MDRRITLTELCRDGGWIAIDKDLEIGSTRIVSMIKRALSQHAGVKIKVGHGGTLDPLASGILPVAVGKATRTVPYVMDGTKKYRFQITFGHSRTTDDFEGEIDATCDKKPAQAELEFVLPKFVGDIEQRPPIYSALRIDGKRSYDLARAGKQVEIKARPVRIDSLEMVDFSGDTARFEVVCGKGVYVRSLARDIALACGSLGFVSELRRVQCGPFREKDAISVRDFVEKISELDKILKNGHKTNEEICAWSLSRALDDILALDLSKEDGVSLLCGRALPLGAEGEGIRKILQDGRLIGLAKLQDGIVTPYKMFTTPEELERTIDVDYR